MKIVSMGCSRWYLSTKAATCSESVPCHSLMHSTLLPTRTTKAHASRSPPPLMSSPASLRMSVVGAGATGKSASCMMPMSRLPVIISPSSSCRLISSFSIPELNRSNSSEVMRGLSLVLALMISQPQFGSENSVFHIEPLRGVVPATMRGENPQSRITGPHTLKMLTGARKSSSSTMVATRVPERLASTAS